MSEGSHFEINRKTACTLLIVVLVGNQLTASWIINGCEDCKGESLLAESRSDSPHSFSATNMLNVDWQPKYSFADATVTLDNCSPPTWEWLADGETILYSDYDASSFVLMNSSTGETIDELFTLPELEWDPSEVIFHDVHPTATNVLFSAIDQTSKSVLLSYDIDSREEHARRSFDEERIFDAEWSHTGDQVAVRLLNDTLILLDTTSFVENSRGHGAYADLNSTYECMFPYGGELTWSSDDSFILASPMDFLESGDFIVWRTDPELQVVQTFQSYHTPACWSPDGDHLVLYPPVQLDASGDEYRYFEIWDTHTWRIVEYVSRLHTSISRVAWGLNHDFLSFIAYVRPDLDDDPQFQEYLEEIGEGWYEQLLVFADVWSGRRTLNLLVTAGGTGWSFSPCFNGDHTKAAIPMGGWFDIWDALNDDSIDNDTMSNSWEFEHGLSIWFDDRDLDDDCDWLLNGEEYAHDTDPQLNDTDGDGILDGVEVHEIGTDPTNPDTDGDGILDGEDPFPLGECDEDGIVWWHILGYAGGSAILVGGVTYVVILRSKRKGLL